MPGTLYVVSTPIGNLQDLTPRAAATFQAVDFIAAEDTRVTVKLLNHLGLKKPMVSYYSHNQAASGEKILGRIAAGESCALCSDAGVPAISDPGEALVRDAHLMGIPVVPVPAASAAVTALCVSGQPTARFVFEGFLPLEKRARAARLEKLKGEESTSILYEAPHKLNRTLADLCKTVGEERPLTICRELTKLHEEIWPATTGEAMARYASDTPRGEFVLVLAGAPQNVQPEETLTLEEAAALALELAVGQGLKASEAAKRAAAETGHPKSDIYRAMQQSRGDAT